MDKRRRLLLKKESLKVLSDKTLHRVRGGIFGDSGTTDEANKTEALLTRFCPTKL